MTSGASDFGAIYAETRQRVADLAAGLSPEQLATTVPGTDEWTVRDVVCHLTGVAADVTTGNTEGAPGPAWTAAQVAARCDASVPDVIAEWEKVAGDLEPRIASAGTAMGFLVADVATHEQDLRGALRMPGFRDSAGVEAGTQVMVNRVGQKLTEAGLGLRMHSGNQEWELGEGEPTVSVTVEPFELFRALAGRRSVRQVAQWKWDGDNGPYLGLVSIFPLRATDLVE